jgi:hypothetical protein
MTSEDFGGHAVALIRTRSNLSTVNAASSLSVEITRRMHHDPVSFVFEGYILPHFYYFVHIDSLRIITLHYPIMLEHPHRLSAD